MKFGQDNELILRVSHLADEAAHVAWDLDLLDAIWKDASRTKRGLNARILRFVMREFFVSPRRANLEVARQLAAEFPELARSIPHWKSQLKALGNDPAYHHAWYNASNLRRTFAGFRSRWTTPWR